jgi:hypothetical protein
MVFEEEIDPLMFEQPCGKPGKCHTHICCCKWRERQDLTLAEFKKMLGPRKGSTIERME